ncbi:MAG TPA: hypothetical protein VM597_17465 [Gemmataceae bacterium]|jgi:hypothetical protein|nr:hypothetical protein [Gemmataceae bacterium]
MDVSRWNTPVMFFPWPYVQEAIDQIDAQVYRAAVDLAQELHANRARSCSDCSRVPTDLFWVCVTSPNETWRSKEGCVGFLTICEKCRLQVDFLIDQELTDLHAQD